MACYEKVMKMHRIANWFGTISRAFLDGFKRVEKQPNWEVTIEFSQGTKRKIEVSKETWEDMKRWMDGLSESTSRNAYGSLYKLETEGHSLRLVRDYVAVMEGKRR